MMARRGRSAVINKPVLIRTALALLLVTNIAVAWPQQQQNQLRPDQQQGSSPATGNSNAASGRSASPASPSPGSSASSGQTPSAGSSDQGVGTSWLYHSMVKMAIEAHNTIVSGTQIRQCTGASAGPGGGGRSGGLAKRDDNVLFSPLSVSSALSTLMLGSWGNTLSEIRAALGYPANTEALPEADINAAYKANLDLLLKAGRGVEINYANTLFGGAGLNVILYFYQDIQNFYKSAIRGVDFLNRPDRAQKEINRWVGEQTKGKITEILPTPPSTDTKLAVANAVYFKGAWEHVFNEEFTKEEDFFVSENDVVKVPMMKEVMEIPFIRDSNLQLTMVALPYKTAQFALYILLPDQPGLDSLVRMERTITEPDIDSLIRRMSISTVQVSLPRFKLSWRADLQSVLRNLGVCDVFSQGGADLQRLATEDGLFLSFLTHQAVMEVNEKGTVAAAATVGAVSKTARSFAANRPFMFFIRDNFTGLPLFWGRVARPEAAKAPGSS